MTSTPTPHSPDRRTVLRTAAWATPAVIAASTTPAFAASPLTLNVHLGETVVTQVHGSFYGVRFDGFTITPDKFISRTKGIQVTLTATAAGQTAAFMYSPNDMTDYLGDWDANAGHNVAITSLTLTCNWDTPAQYVRPLSGLAALVVTPQRNAVADPTVTVTVTSPDATSPVVFTIAPS